MDIQDGYKIYKDYTLLKKRKFLGIYKNITNKLKVYKKYKKFLELTIETFN